MKTVKLIIAATFMTAPIALVSTHASASSAFCSALKNGATWTSRSSSRNAGKTGSIKLTGSCAVGASGTAQIVWDGESTTEAYKVKSSSLVIGSKVLRGRKKSNGGWTITNTSSPI